MTNSPASPDIEAGEASGSSAHAGHYTNPRRGFLFFLGWASIGAGMAQLTPAVLTLSLKALAIEPKNSSSVLSITIAIGALFSIVAFPVFGRISDRTLSRFGRRRPFLFLGAALVIVGAVVIFAASSTAVLTIGWILTTVGYSAATVAFTSVIADQFAPLRRGPAASLVGLSLPLGALVGLFIAQLVSGSIALQIFIPAFLAALGMVVFGLIVKDRQITRDERPAFTVASFFSTFWVNPARSPNFAWAWWSRLLIFLGVAALNAYQAFYLIFELHFTGATVSGAIFLATLVLTVAALIFAPITGKLSDRLKRRKPFVIAAAVIFAIGLSVAANAHSFPAFLVAIAITGVGQGVYFAVDIALVTQLLPDPDNAGQPLGVMNLANTLPGSIVPALAPAVLLIGATAANAHNYSALFIGGAIAAIVGALAILPIRKVR